MNQQAVDFADKFVKAIDGDYSAKEGEEFEALLDEQTIIITDIITESDFYFLQNIMRQAQNLTLPALHPFTWSLLHELGHLETADDIVDDTEDRHRIRCSPLSVRDAFEEYSTLHNERIANQWAIDFVLDFPETILRVDEHLVNLLHE